LDGLEEYIVTYFYDKNGQVYEKSITLEKEKQNAEPKLIYIHIYDEGYTGKKKRKEVINSLQFKTKYERTRAENLKRSQDNYDKKKREGILKKGEMYVNKNTWLIESEEKDNLD